MEVSKMKKTYSIPEVVMIELAVEDILTESPNQSLWQPTTPDKNWNLIIK